MECIPTIVSVPTNGLLWLTKPTWHMLPKDEFVFKAVFKAIEAEEAGEEEAFVSDFSNVNVRSRSGKI